MKKNALRTALFVLLALALIGGGVYAAVRYGTQDDPLVTMSYLTDVAENEINDAIDAKVNAAVQDAQKQVQSAVREAAAVYRPVDLAAGKSLKCPAGAEVVLTAGSAVTTGAFTDVTTGEALASGESLAANHLYLAAEDGASLKAGDSARLLVRGAQSG